MTMADQWRELFRIADTKRACVSCDEMPGFVRAVLDPRTGKTIRMFECKCGKQGWMD
jgi:hypothetical protein